MAAEARQIVDRESFAAWLKGKDKTWAQVLAARAALRVLPMASFRHLPAKQADDCNLAVFRACAISWAARKWPANDMGAAAAAARAHAFAVFAAPSAAARAAAAAADSAAAHASAHAAAANAAAASSAAAAADSTSADVWAAIARDTQTLERALDVAQLASSSLWPEKPPPQIEGAWRQLHKQLTSRDKAWRPWIKWYEERLRGAKPDEDLELARAFVPNAIWKQGLAAVNVHIGRTKGTISKKTLHSNAIHRQSEKTVKGSHSASKKTGKTRPNPPRADIASGTDTSDLLPDAPSSDADFLNRAQLAFVLAGRINQIHDSQKKLADRGDSEAPASFVIHIDAPWGGGKTSFASYLTRILNHVSYGSDGPQWLKEQPLDDDNKWPKEYRRPWFIVHFDAWRNQHNDPPWWSFYQSTRQQILDQIKEPMAGHVLGPFFVPWHRGKAWVRELSWRASAPDLVNNLLVIGGVLLVLLFMWALGLVGFDDKGEIKLGGGTTGLVSLIIAALLGGAQVVRTFILAFTSSLLPGTPDAAKNYSLGSGDPLNRFREHFANVMRRCKRPIMVVIDDLDRCEPKFVVELARGMQTILKSERVIYLLLGDRDWITQSFSVVHKDMEGIEAGPEHGFGQRFMEKAIQFSFVLPEISPEERKAYTRRILGLEQPRLEAALEAAPDLQEEFKGLSKIPSSLEREEAATALRAKVRQRGLQSSQLERLINLELAQRSAADKTAEAATRHRLEGITHVLPANPRQIKRIINTITYLQEVARLEADWQPGSPEWQRLARWIVLMIEWPRSWFTLSRNPQLLNEVYNAKTRTLFAKEIRKSSEVMALLDFKRGQSGSDWKEVRITVKDAKKLAELLPATSGEALKLSEAA